MGGDDMARLRFSSWVLGSARNGLLRRLLGERLSFWLVVRWEVKGEPIVEACYALWMYLFGWLTPPRLVALILGVIGVLVGYEGYLYRYCGCRTWPSVLLGWQQFFYDFYANISTSLIAITITVFTIDWLNERRSDQQLKIQLLREMGHPSDNGICLRAVRELEARGWLDDGTLSGVSLYKADLRGADLHSANLFQADLRKANLSGADLSEASLQDANLQEADLRGANLRRAYLLYANLCGANLQDAILPRDEGLHYNCLLGTNLQGANLKGADTQGVNLHSAHLQGATMPDGSIHE